MHNLRRITANIFNENKPTSKIGKLTKKEKEQLRET